MTTQIFPVALFHRAEAPRELGAWLVSPDRRYKRFAFCPTRPLIHRTEADVLSVRVEYKNGERVELLLQKPIAAASFGPNSTVARSLIRQSVVMRPGDRLVVELELDAGDAQGCVLGDGFDEEPG